MEKRISSEIITDETGARWIVITIKQENGESYVLGECLDMGTIVIPEEPEREPER